MHFRLEPASPIPMYLQIVEQVRHAVGAGALQAGEELPSVRALASHHLINPNTVVRAYLELEHEGLLTKRRGAGTFVSESAAALSQRHRLRAVGELLQKAIGTAREFGLTDEQLDTLWEKHLHARKEQSA
jgi:GntR family transcriptional regulator